jgi:hypothetical protein
MNWPVRQRLVGPWHLSVGPLDLWLVPGLDQRGASGKAGEIEALWSTSGDDSRALSLDAADPPPDLADRMRLAVDQPDVVVSPRTSPLAVMARAERPILVGPGRTLNVFLSTPLWIEVETDAGKGFEVAAQPVKHAWSGATTEGNLCIATRTLLRLHLDNVDARPHRILTAVELHNHHDEPLRVERMVLPMPLARVYATETGLWSETIRLVHRGDRTDAEPHGPPGEARHAELVAEARSPASRSVLKHVFDAVLGGMG